MARQASRRSETESEDTGKRTGSGAPRTTIVGAPEKPKTLEAKIKREPNPLKRFLKILGPGFITGASDDDPSGIGTYAVAGAQFGFAMLWTALFTVPLMAAVQFICAKVGMVSGMGLAGALRRHYSPSLLYPAVL